MCCATDMFVFLPVQYFEPIFYKYGVDLMVNGACFLPCRPFAIQTSQQSRCSYVSSRRSHGILAALMTTSQRCRSCSHLRAVVPRQELQGVHMRCKFCYKLRWSATQ
jgi:hypothetical protein